MNKKINTDFFLKVSTGKNWYNIDTTKFKGYYVNEDTGVVSSITEPFSEIINAASGNTATLSQDVEGKKKLTFNDASGILDGDIIKIDTSYYYVEGIVGNIITIRSACDLHSSGSTATVVGNTGIYKVKLNIPTSGSYTAFINNASIGMQNYSCSLFLTDASNADIEEQISLLADEITRSSFI